MSRDIEYIQNLTAYAILDNTGEFSIQGGFPTNPDEVIIRSVTYSHGAGAAKAMVLIHCNLANQVIASAIASAQFSSQPGTRIQTRNPISNVLTFKIMAPFTPMVQAFADAEYHEICISMDFIKYRQK